MNKVENKRSYEVLNEVISPNNVLAMAELIAIRQTKYLSSIMGGDMIRFHHELYGDLMNLNNPNHKYSDGYDLVQEGALYLCQNYGRKLDDIVGYTKKGKAITIKKLCIKEITKLVSRKFSKPRQTTSIDELPLELQPITEFEQPIEEDYTKVDEMIQTMQLTENHIIVLNCRMSGMSFPEIGRILDKCTGTIYDLYCTIRRRYIKYYGNI